MRSRVAVVVAATIIALSIGSKGESRSAALAAQLSLVMVQQKLEAIAAKDPSADDRFVAALLFPGVQLLVTAGAYPVPSLLHQQIDQRLFREVYYALQGAPNHDTRVFFHDMGADGLRGERGAAVDILYERVTQQTVFDGNWAKHGMTEQTYVEKLAKADAEYSRLLALLLERIRPAHATPVPERR
jgi:hypothetical protein